MARDTSDRVVLDKLSAVDDKIDDLALAQHRRFEDVNRSLVSLTSSVDTYELQARADRRFWGVVIFGVVLACGAIGYIWLLVRS